MAVVAVVGKKSAAAPAPAPDAAQPNDYASGVITKEEVEARGAGTDDHGDTYDPRRLWWSEYRAVNKSMSPEARSARAVAAALTRFGAAGCWAPTAATTARWRRRGPWAPTAATTARFPLFGALIGAWGAAFFAAALVLWPPGIAALISTFATVWLTGCFHEDGLADTFDGFGGGWGRAQILRIMKDSRVGTYALVGTALTLQLKAAALAALAAGPGGPAAAAAALVAVHAASRWTAIPLIYCCTYIQDDEDAKRGMYNWMAQSTRLLTARRLLLSTALAAALPLAALGAARAGAVWLVTAATAAAAGAYGNAVLGGVIGDFMGATIQVAEVLSVLCADWSRLDSLAAGSPLLVLAGVAALPVIYCRRVVDWGSC
ncbi:Cobalamin synthase [Tetrabaena socialis]|uniref:Adenosylcobinamide-GDP ribazoletransferase n=1 Tax=Tetrabaena socialis TaxID=47790 RepID=A0A2J7ZUN4_9CHLO|nr:Cobalamin synthase [Tetrabaena socialis]|eukprot:PNH03985.1 Cobalamin synthase [Tetrabaena socialis]